MTVTELMNSLKYAWRFHGDIPVTVTLADYDCSPKFVDTVNGEFVISVDVKNISTEELDALKVINSDNDTINDFISRPTVEEDIADIDADPAYDLQIDEEYKKYLLADALDVDGHVKTTPWS